MCTSSVKTSILHRLFDGKVDVKIACSRWRGCLNVLYGFFTDGHSGSRIKIDDVRLESKSILNEIKTERKQYDHVRACVMRDIEKRVETMFLHKLEAKRNEDSRAGSIIRASFSSKRPVKKN